MKNKHLGILQNTDGKAEALPSVSFIKKYCFVLKCRFITIAYVDFSQFL